MFFPNKITLIKPRDKVLEVGPGSTPYDRSDVFLELKYECENTAINQRGVKSKLITNKLVIFYDGGKFPFYDNEFDYVVCSHVIEHVPNVKQFISELFRVASKGYIEYPTILYEYLYNFEVHQNLCYFNKNTFYFMKKSSLPFDNFKPIQNKFLSSLQAGYVSFVNELQPFLFQGFEWDKPFSVSNKNDLSFFIPSKKIKLKPNKKKFNLLHRILSLKKNIYDK